MFLFTAMIIINIGSYIVIPGLWLLGLRPYIAKHGGARVTAANWFLSMWADWSVACDLSRKSGDKTWVTSAFILLWSVWLGSVIAIFLLSRQGA